MEHNTSIHYSKKNPKRTMGSNNLLWLWRPLTFGTVKRVYEYPDVFLALKSPSEPRRHHVTVLQLHCNQQARAGLVPSLASQPMLQSVRTDCTGMTRDWVGLRENHKAIQNH